MQVASYFSSGHGKGEALFLTDVLFHCWYHSICSISVLGNAACCSIPFGIGIMCFPSSVTSNMTHVFSDPFATSTISGVFFLMVCLLLRFLPALALRAMRITVPAALMGGYSLSDCARFVVPESAVLLY